MNSIAMALILLAQESFEDFEAESAAESAQQLSLLEWAYQSLGPFYILALFGSGFVIFVGGCLVVLLARRPSVSAAYLVFVPIPLLIGVFGTFEGFIAAMSVMGTSSSAPQASEIAEGLSMSSFSTLVGILCMLPAFFVVSLGLFLKTLLWKPPPRLN